VSPGGDGWPQREQAAEAAAAAWRALAPVLAGTPHVRVSRDGGRTYPARHAGPLPADPPGQPATIPVYDPGSGTGRLLAADLDPGRVPGGADEAGVQAAALAALVGQLGGECITDVSPRGGRHVYVVFAEPLPWRDLRDVARALAARFPAVDPAPHASLGGQVSPPGARHRSGGWRLLTMPLADAVAIAARPCGPGVWSGLLAEFAAELASVAPVAAAGGAPDGAEPDGDGSAWFPRPGGRAPLSAALEAIARIGRWDRARYPGRSEARMAVLTAAAGRGWRLADVREAITSGRWPGLARLYARPRERNRLERLLPAEWQKSLSFVLGEENVRSWHTSDGPTRPPAGHGGAGPDEYGHIRRWMTAVDCAAADPHRVARWGRHAVSVRLVLAAAGQAAMVAGSRVIEFGTRNLALHSGLSHRTVARVLVLLRDEDDPLVDLVSRHRLARADRYDLRIPAEYAASAAWRRRRAGRIEAIHPVFLELGGVAGLVYQALGLDEVPGAEVARAARLSASAVSVALRGLAEHGLAEHGPCGWRRGPASLDDVAESTGAADLWRERAAAYARERTEWRGLIGSWLARPAPGPDDDPPPPLDEILGQLEPPEWLTGDPGPPAAAVAARS
jgi:hypothetical protein